MTTYPFLPTVAIDIEGDLAPGGSGAVYAITDTTFTTPLTASDINGAVMASVPVSSIGVTAFFTVEDHGTVMWKSGSLPPVVLVSHKGYADAAEAAQAAAEAAETAATDLAALVTEQQDSTVAAFVETDGTATQGAVLGLSDTDATPELLTRRDAAGRASFAEPTEPTHAATKGYVDTLLSSTVKGEDGRELRVVAGVIRNAGGPSYWQPISDVGHESVNVDSVSTATTHITIDYTSIGATKVVSFVVGADETLAKAGVIAGSSVGLTQASVYLSLVKPYADFVEYNGTTWVSNQGVFTLSFSAGILTCTHPSIPAGAAVFDVAVTGRGDLIASSHGASATTALVRWHNYSGVHQTTAATTMRAFVSHGASGPLNPQALDTTLYPNSNLWFVGVFEVEA